MGHFFHNNAANSLSATCGISIRAWAAKTIVDCFRCPRQISREGALEALRESLANGVRLADIAAVAQREYVRSIRPLEEALT